MVPDESIANYFSCEEQKLNPDFERTWENTLREKNVIFLLMYLDEGSVQEIQRYTTIRVLNIRDITFQPLARYMVSNKFVDSRLRYLDAF